MPELPDITIYVEALQRRVGGRTLRKVRVLGPSVVKTFDPPISIIEGRSIIDVRRLGKRIVFDFGDGLCLVLHLMIAGRLHWRNTAPKPRPRLDLAAFAFENGVLLLTEASTRKRVSIHVVRGEAALEEIHKRGLEPLETDLSSFRAAIRSGNHTLKRALTNPTTFSGIGNAYSDEILHRARLSPVMLTLKLTNDEIGRLHAATRDTIQEWTVRLRRETGDSFPEKVTAFREGMAVHGRFKKPCPVCGSQVQRIVRGENESNYCPTCQTGGKLLRDRALSRLLREDWPETIEELEEMKVSGSGGRG